MYDPRADVDGRYARGEVTREEWIRQKALSPGGSPVPGPPAPPPPPRPAIGSGRILFVVVVCLVAVAVAAAFLWYANPSPLAAWNPNYAQPKQLHVGDLAALNASATQGQAFTANNTLWFGSGAMTIVAYGSPADHDMAFVIQGMVNPTIRVPSGARMILTMVNMDSGEYHTWSLTAQAPPYGSSGMMGSGGMMSGTMMGTSSLGPMSSGGMWSEQMSLTPQAGRYWYVCAVSNHAAGGMYGAFVVG